MLIELRTAGRKAAACATGSPRYTLKSMVRLFIVHFCGWQLYEVLLIEALELAIVITPADPLEYPIK